MNKTKLAPVQSYHKATLIALFDNEGEVKWDRVKLARHMNNNPDLIFELEDAGYIKSQQGFTAQQVALLFKYINHPILNEANRKLLKLTPIKHKLLDNFEKNNHLINRDMEYLPKLSDGALSGLGLRKKDGGDLNPHYEFVDNDHFYFIRTIDGFFDMHEYATLKVVKTIESTDELVRELLKLKNKD